MLSLFAPRLRVAVALAVMVTLVAGCGGDHRPGSSTVAPITTTTPLAASVPLPAVNVPAGRYRVDQFAVPFDLTTEGDWRRVFGRSDIVALGRVGIGEVVVTQGIVPGSTSAEALDLACLSGAMNLGPSSNSELLSRPAQQREGTVTSDCHWATIDGTKALVVPVGNTVRLIATSFGGLVVLVLANATTDQWPAFSAELDALLASMTPVV